MLLVRHHKRGDQSATALLDCGAALLHLTIDRLIGT
jgi:hypothetical protein